MKNKILFINIFLLSFFLIFATPLIKAATTTVCDGSNCTVTINTTNLSWSIPTGVTSITALAIGGGGAGSRTTSAGGGGAGGDLIYSSLISISGSNLTIIVGAGGIASGATGETGGFSNISNSSGATLLLAGGGGGGTTAANGTRNGTSTTLGGVVTGGGGGAGGTASGTAGCGGGGGAGGWYGRGGAGGAVGSNNGVASTGGGGGGGGGAPNASAICGGGGGVGIFTAGINGTGGAFAKFSSGGTNGSQGTNGTDISGGLYGGGGGGDDTGANAGNGGAGIIILKYSQIYPIFSTFNSTPANNTEYSSGAIYKFNSTLSNTNGTIGIEFNSINYTTTNLSSVFNTTIINLGTGTYSYYWWGYGNGTLINYNTSSIQSYTVAKATQSITSLLNGNNANLVITYPQQINASYSGTNNTNVIISVNGTQINKSQNYTLGVDGWVVNYSLTTNQNYTGTDYFLNLTINKGTSEVNLTLNHTEGNISISSGNSIYLNGTLISGDSGGRLLLYNNGTLINNGTSPISNLTTFNTAGLYNITVIYQTSQNYSTSFETYWINVTATDTCTCPSINTNWEINMGDSCNIISTCDLGTGNITFIGTGTTTFNAAISCRNLEYPTTSQTLFIGSNAVVRIG